MRPPSSADLDSDAAAQRAADRAIKRDRVLALLENAGAASVLLTSDAAVNWYLDGGRQHVGLTAAPIVAVRVSRGGDAVFVTSNEAPRLVAEELPRDVAVIERAWHETLDVSLGTSAHLAAERAESDLDAELRAARAVLLPGELARFRALGTDSARVLTDALLAAEPGWSERRLAAQVAAGLVAIGVDPVVILVGGASRMQYPHALPTEAPLGRRALLVACARRDGLIANLSRWVSFEPMTAAERDAERRILDVEADAFAATTPGTPLREVLAAIASSYPAHGFDAARWTRHHQGGAAGYAGRDPRAAPSTTDVVQAGQAFAWNPWAPGAKVEDTVLLAKESETDRAADAPRIEPLTVDDRWPTVRVAGLARPVTLER
jgi:Xaa-Pro aminopeptidase